MRTDEPDAGLVIPRDLRATVSAFQTHWRWPLATATLPWPVRFRALSRIARKDRVAFPEEAAAYAEARRFGFARLPENSGTIAGEAEWCRAWRLVQLVDHDDLFYTLRHRRSTVARSLEVIGEWPAKGPFLALTYHWGAGLLALAHLAQNGRRARFVSARFDQRSLGDDAWRWRYARLRGRAIERLCGGSIIYTGDATDRIVAALKQGDCVVGLCDALIDEGRSRVDAPFGDLRLSMPRGLLRLAVASSATVVPFAAGVDRATGRRDLEVGEARSYTDEAALAANLSERLLKLVQRDPAAWHMWPHASRILV